MQLSGYTAKAIIFFSVFRDNQPVDEVYFLTLSDKVFADVNSNKDEREGNALSTAHKRSPFSA